MFVNQLALLFHHVYLLKNILYMKKFYAIYPFKKVCLSDWRDDLVVKRICCSCRGLEFGSQHSHGDS